MRNLRNRYTYKQRRKFDYTIKELWQYIKPLLLERQNSVCDICKQPQTKWDIHHKVYNPMLTMNELQLLCIPCHHSITDYTHLSTA